MATTSGPLTRLVEAVSGVVTDFAAAWEMTLDTAAWYEGMTRTIIRSHIQATIAGKGGLLRTGISDWRRVAGQIQQELTYLRTFAIAVAAGGLTAAQIAARSALYSNHAQVSYWSALDAGQKQRGFTQERRVLGAAEHCPDCVGYAAQGWVPIGTLPAPGDGSVCRANCKCTKEYR